jgi:methionine-gamma-lyase
MNQIIGTRLIHKGEYERKSISRSKSLPISMTSVFSFDNAEDLDLVYEGREHGYIYTRNGNPVHDALSEIMADIDGGEAALAYSSGMAAITLSIIANVKAGDHVLAAAAVYGGTFMLLKTELARLGASVTFVDPVNEDIRPYMQANTRIVYVETISNPTMEVVDLGLVASIAHEYGAKLVVDNSFATPVICRPIEHGADIVVYSATKYLGGHSDLTAGIVVGDRESIDRIYSLGLLYGATLSPFDAWLLVRSLRTLELRMRMHSNNGWYLASCLKYDYKGIKVHYPYWKQDETNSTARKYFTEDLYGGMLSIELDGGEEAARIFIRRLEKVKLVPSLAGVSTTVSYPAITSHRALSDGELRKAGISRGLIRISTGLEDEADIASMFDSALEGLHERTTQE